jgi:hypothetical protein
MHEPSSQNKARPLVKTGDSGKKLPPGIFRRGNRYVVTFRDPQGRQRKRSARTLAEAREVKAAMTADVARGEFRDVSRITFGEYAPSWIEGYQGRTRRGFRDETRRDYRRALGLDQDGQPFDPPSGAVAFFGRMRLVAITPLDVKRYAEEVRKPGVAENTVRLAVAPLKCLLATAVEDGLIRSNPAAGLRIGQAVAGDGGSERERAKALTEDELRRLIEQVAQVALREARGSAVAEDGATLVGAAEGAVRRGRRDDRLRRRQWRPGGCFDGVPGREGGGGQGRRSLGGTAHAPAHLRHDPVRPWPEREAGAAMARAPRGELHSGHVHRTPERGVAGAGVLRRRAGRDNLRRGR